MDPRPVKPLLHALMTSVPAILEPEPGAVSTRANVPCAESHPAIRTAIVTASLSRKAGGLFDALRRLSQSLVADHGVDVEILGLRDEAAELDSALWHPLEPRAFATRGPAAFGYSPEMGRALDALEADVTHGHGLWMYPSLAVLRRQRRRAHPSLVSPHGMLDPWALKHSRWKKRLASLWFERERLQRASCLHALCTAEAGAFRAYGLRNPVCVIPNGVDLPEGPSNQPAPWASEAEPDRPVLLYLGRLHPKKGLDPLIRAWHLLRHANAGAKEWRLAIAGWDQGGHALELKAMTRELGLEDSVRFLGPLFGAAKSAAYEHAAAYVLPSFSEGLPLTVLEAWAWGKPVLMTPACNLEEGFAAGAALPMDAEPRSIQDALQTLLGMPEEERIAMGWRGRALVASKFTWKRVAGEMRGVYAWMLGGGAPPECVATCGTP